MRTLKIARREGMYNRQAMIGATSNAGFDELSARVFKLYNGPSDAWSHYFQAVSRDVQDLQSGVTEIDAAWWRENGGGEQPDAQTLLCAQVAKSKAELVVLDGVHKFSASEIAAIRSVRGVRWIIGTAGVDIAGDPSLSAIDGLLTCMKAQARAFSSSGLPSAFLPHAFDPRALEQLPPQPARAGFVFVGHLIAGPHMHDTRREVIGQLVRTTPLEVYGDGSSHSFAQELSRYGQLAAGYVIGRFAAAAGLTKDVERQTGNAWITRAARMSEWGRPRWNWMPGLSQALRPAVFGHDMAALMQRTALSLNCHVGLAGPYAANVRLFEITGYGACMLTDHKSDLHEFWEPDSEVVSYTSAKDAAAKARYLLDNPSIMADIGALGHKRTLRDHSYAARLPLIAEHLHAMTGGAFERL